MRDGRTALYRLYDDSEQLLYVGIAFDPRTRWKAHAREKPWWPEVCIREIEWLHSREEAERAEAVAIEEEEPRYNVIGNVPVKLPKQLKQCRPKPTVEEVIAGLERRRNLRRAKSTCAL